MSIGDISTYIVIFCKCLEMVLYFIVSCLLLLQTTVPHAYALFIDFSAVYIYPDRVLISGFSLAGAHSA